LTWVSALHLNRILNFAIIPTDNPPSGESWISVFSIFGVSQVCVAGAPNLRSAAYLMSFKQISAVDSSTILS
jgi:hypothetical protein